MTVAYATAEELAGFVSTTIEVGEADRLLERASELLDEKVTAPFSIDPETGLPSDPALALVLRDACCAQVEYWLVGPGEEHDVEGHAGQQISVGGTSMTVGPELGPRAKRILAVAGAFTIYTTAELGQTARSWAP